MKEENSVKKNSKKKKFPIKTLHKMRVKIGKINKGSSLFLDITKLFIFLLKPKNKIRKLYEIVKQQANKKISCVILLFKFKFFLKIVSFE